MPVADTLRGAFPAAVPGDKFWVVDNLWNTLHGWGLSERASNGLSFVVLCAVLALLVWLLDLFLSKVVLSAIKKSIQRSKTNIDDILFKHKFFNRLLSLLPLFVVLVALGTLFEGFHPSLVTVARIATQVMLIVTFTLAIFSLLDAFNEIYNKKHERAQRRKSIKGYIQITKIVFGFIAGILILSVLLRKDPTTLLVGLGAAAAVLSLVFKDTILGFVASIQLSAQDMVRPGDWIEMPGKKADGKVVDITVNSVKVQNWDNTYTLIPIYSMVSEPFVNWRGMENSKGRRLVRQFPIDVMSVGEFTPDMEKALLAAQFHDPALVGKALEIVRDEEGTSASGRFSNLALLRVYLGLYLLGHPLINEELPLYVRYLAEVTDKGVILELYCFTHEKGADGFYLTANYVVEHVLSVLPLFGLRIFQVRSGYTV